MPYLSKKVFEELQHAGNMCSNVCFNLSQNSEPDDADSMRSSYQAWDSAKSSIRQELLVRKKNRKTGGRGNE